MINSKLFYLSLVLFTIFSNPQLYALEFNIKLRDKSEKETVKTYLSRVENKLPPIVLEYFKSRGVKIKLEFEDKTGFRGKYHYSHCGDLSIFNDQDIKKIQKNENNLSSSRKHILNSHSYTIELDRSLLEAIVMGEQNKTVKYKCGHKDSYTHAQAVLIRELMIVFDKENIKLPLEEANMRKCQRLSKQLDLEDDGDWTGACSYLNFERSVSRSPSFTGLAGWDERGFFGRYKNLNSGHFRSPSILEFKSLEKSFAVNMEYFLLDHEFACRKPRFYSYFFKLFNYKPFRSKNCKVNPYFTMLNNSSKSSLIREAKLDPDRIYEVHYLFAGRGDQLMSHWGHAMYRLVICAPKTPLGPKCLHEKAHDIVLSYRAEVRDASIDYIKGLRGKYKSRLYFQSLTEVINEYTLGEFRDVYSMPLNLTSQEIKAVGEAALEQYWNYNGRYFFLSNNCADEALNLLKVALLENLELQQKSILTPLGLDKYLKNSGLGVSSVFDDLERARVQGYFFPRASKSLDQSYEKLKDALDLEYNDFREYVEQTTALDRAKLIDQMKAKKIPGPNVVQFYQLEKSVQKHLDKQLVDKLSKLANSKKYRKKFNDEFFMKIKSFEERMVQKTPEASIKSNSHYGVPLDYEYTRLSDDEVKKMSQSYSTQMNRAVKNLESYLGDEVKEIKQTQLNQINAMKLLFDSQ